MYLWIDDIRPVPRGYAWARSVNDAKVVIEYYEHNILDEPMHINMSYSAKDDKNYTNLLDWLRESDYVDERYTFHFHIMNIVDFQDTAAFCKKNNWVVV